MKHSKLKRNQIAPALDAISKDAAEKLREQRVRACAAEVNAVLEKHKCRLLPIVTIANGQVQEQVQIVSL